MDFSRLGRGHRIAGGAGALLLIDLFLTWYSANAPDDILDRAEAAGVSTTASAWLAFDLTDILLAALAIAAILAVVQHMGLLKLPFRLSGILLPAAALMTLWVLYRIINQPDDNDLVNVEWGAYLGLVLTALVAYGASKANNEHESVGPVAASTTAPPSTTTPAASTPPPAASTPPPAASTPPPAAPPRAEDPPPPPPPAV